uniref:Uncharacterized protein n=1 Tax=Anopheles darlingi TaxID=43151 RepID=A0A2M4DQK5_ANODA
MAAVVAAVAAAVAAIGGSEPADISEEGGSYQSAIISSCFTVSVLLLLFLFNPVADILVFCTLFPLFSFIFGSV